MIGNIKEIFSPKTGMREKQLLQDPGYVKGVKTICCMLHGMLQGSTKYLMSEESKDIKIAIIIIIIVQIKKYFELMVRITATSN